MGYIEDAERLIAHVKQIKQTGAGVTQGQADPPADIGILRTAIRNGCKMTDWKNCTIFPTIRKQG